ncbi:MAG: tetratricopeptide repeat protein [Candidatus Obscuribacterales bacterium]|nr:tetratricopeptide repeat protein [Candidatus Obscuribacterales bacterium]
MKAKFFGALILLFVTLSVIDAADAATGFEKHFEVGKTYLVNQKFEMALKEFNQALLLSPNNASILVERGTAFNGLEKYDQAIKDFSSALKVAPDTSLAFNNRGVAYLRMGQYAQAIKDLDRAAALNPKDPVAYLNRAGASMCCGQGLASADKLASWLGAVNWKSDFAGHAAVLAALGYRQGNQPKKAKEILDTALIRTDKLKWPHPALRYLSSTIKGKELLEEAESSDYDTTQAHYFIAQNLILNKDSKQAKLHLDWIVGHGVRNSVEYWIARGLVNSPVK